MVKVTDLLMGIRVLEKVNSQLNGEITVIESLAFGKYMQVGGLTQSGGIIRNIWDKTLKKVSTKNQVEKVLVLGLGGGSIIKVIRKYWPKAKITAIDIDAVMVRLGKKYLNMDDYGVDVKIADAFEYLKKETSKKTKFDLICVDLYIGDEFPKKFETENYIHLVGRLLSTGGIAVFNRLYYGEKRKEAVKFGNLLEKSFPKVDVIYPEANITFVCYKNS